MEKYANQQRYLSPLLKGNWVRAHHGLLSPKHLGIPLTLTSLLFPIVSISHTLGFHPKTLESQSQTTSLKLSNILYSSELHNPKPNKCIKENPSYIWFHMYPNWVDKSQLQSKVEYYTLKWRRNISSRKIRQFHLESSFANRKVSEHCVGRCVNAS